MKILFLLSLLLVLNAPFYFWGSEVTKNILIINSYHRGYGWTDEVCDSMRKELERDKRIKNIYIEYLDRKRFPDDRIVDNLIAFYQDKYRDIKPDVILTTDDIALKTALELKKNIFLGVPIVFSGVSRNNARLLIKDDIYLTGVYEEPDPEGNLKLMRRDIPGLKKVYIVHDKTESAMGIARDIEAIFKTEAKDIEREYVSDLTFEELLEYVKTFDKKTAILLPSYAVDKGNLKYSPEEFASKLSEVSRVPVYGMYYHMFGSGITGGSLLNGRIHGEMAAKIVIRIIDGVPISKIYPFEKKSVIEAYDFVQIKKYNIPIKRLSKGAFIINKPSSFFKEMRKQVVPLSVILSFFLILLFLIAVLLRIIFNLRVKLKEKQAFLEDRLLVLKQKEDYINKNIVKYEYISEFSNDIALEWDFTSNERLYSKKISDMLGYEEEEISDISAWLKIIHPDDKNLVMLNFNKYLYGELDYYSQEYRVRKKSGEYIWVRVSGKLLKDSNGKANYFFGVITDISKIKEDAKKYFHLSYFDPLTGLANLTKFKNDLNSVTSAGSKEEYLFVTLDFDNFKFVNESFGYEVGDLILLQTSERLRDIVPEKFFSARYENDQFFLFIKINRRKIEDIVKKIRDVFSYPFSIDGKTFYISASIGAVIYPKNGDNYEKLFKNAQIALNNCKKIGKGGYSLFLEPAIFGTSDTLGYDNSRYEDKIVVDFEKDTLDVFFQPTFDLSEGRASSFETLARYLKSDGRYINAGEFIPTAEEDEEKINKLSINITRKTFEKIRKFNQTNGKEVKFSINLSPINLIDKSFLDSFLDIFEEYRIPYQNIQIELSEISMVDYLDSLRDNIIFLKDKGVGIVIDHFGTGHASLAILKDLPISTIKIDSSLIKDIVSKEENYFVVNTVISLAKSMWINAVPVGVENEIQARYLLERGCNIQQGYYFAKPLLFEKFNFSLPENFASNLFFAENISSDNP